MQHKFLGEFSYVVVNAVYAVCIRISHHTSFSNSYQLMTALYLLFEQDALHALIYKIYIPVPVSERETMPLTHRLVDTNV